MIDIIIFSKNRPLQLYALLESLYSLTDAKDTASVTVIHKYDDPYEKSLSELKEKFNHVNFIQQADFKKDTLAAIFASTNQHCAFLVDDIVFKTGVSFKDIVNLISANDGVLTFSMRLGLHLNFCYPSNSDQPVPNGNVINEIFVWEWTNGKGDWGYPISLDGHVLRKHDVLKWTSRINFNNPNQYEDYMQATAKMEKIPTHCVCHTSSIIVNLPLNRVQSEYQNRCGDISPEELLEIWQQGKKIDVKAVYKINNTSAHFPISIPLTERN